MQPRLQYTVGTKRTHTIHGKNKAPLGWVLGAKGTFRVTVDCSEKPNTTSVGKLADFGLLGSPCDRFSSPQLLINLLFHFCSTLLQATLSRVDFDCNLTLFHFPFFTFRCIDRFSTAEHTAFSSHNDYQFSVSPWANDNCTNKLHLPYARTYTQDTHVCIIWAKTQGPREEGAGDTDCLIFPHPNTGRTVVGGVWTLFAFSSP